MLVLTKARSRPRPTWAGRPKLFRCFAVVPVSRTNFKRKSQMHNNILYVQPTLSVQENGEIAYDDRWLFLVSLCTSLLFSAENELFCKVLVISSNYLLVRRGGGGLYSQSIL